ncbi:hypothetical protein VHEMI02888 [[Torrubiella] hemipterigena]|uniref:Uncharacterized protein n=1 Tax=[Torrubiella] hemipterigena TaxID=1531966 RepID=A0A0A1T981_9HYPO|nr:hypothetical protein VHEMI02888 [[Torrubiella] hemipterigena]
MARPATPPFEIPCLDLNFGNITDGTDIPPPVMSIPQDVLMQTPPSTPPLDKHDDIRAQTMSSRQMNDNLPPSPISSPRQGSLRRLFSRSKLNVDYVEASQASMDQERELMRPQSRAGMSIRSSRRLKRYSSWFTRLGRHGNDVDEQQDSIYGVSTTSKFFTPPPMIPELQGLEEEDLSLGTDLFRNIK